MYGEKTNFNLLFVMVSHDEIYDVIKGPHNN